MPWNISGQYMETCNCDYLCPCPLTGMAETTHGYCIFAMAFRTDKGEYNGIPLDGVKFVIIGRTPEAMGAGNWQVGLLVDAGANQAQQDSLAQIVGGQAGGPMANIAPLIGQFMGVEARPIEFEGSGSKWQVKVAGRLDQALEGATGLGGENLYLDNMGHPVANRLALARAQHSRLHAFGIDWEDDSGRNNGHFAPFDWRG
ncbi:MAG: DUF1326 domain-containing protein [Dehalococcoidia bacterium]|nr:DUF1326 domain-containing protein [Dehalococcoidia bacterium]